MDATVARLEFCLKPGAKTGMIGGTDVEGRMKACLIAVVGFVMAAGMAAASESPTYYKNVAPILQANCQSCHRPGVVAPMSLLTYESSRPYAKAIKNAVVKRQMPP